MPNTPRSIDQFDCRGGGALRGAPSEQNSNIDILNTQRRKEAPRFHGVIYPEVPFWGPFLFSDHYGFITPFRTNARSRHKIEKERRIADAGPKNNCVRPLDRVQCSAHAKKFRTTWTSSLSGAHCIVLHVRSEEPDNSFVAAAVHRTTSTSCEERSMLSNDKGFVTKIVKTYCSVRPRFEI